MCSLCGRVDLPLHAAQSRLAMIDLVVDPEHPDPTVIGTVARAISEGALAAIPTDTLYGLAVDPFNRAAVARIFEVKGRAGGQALPLVAADSTQVTDWLSPLPPLAARLAKRFWPGPLTLVVMAPDELGRDVTGGTGTVGVRVPASPVTRELLAACGRPLTATSANISGRPATADPDVVRRELGDQLDIMLDGGRTAGGLPSTIVDVTGPEPRLIREGAISWSEVLTCLGHV